MKKIFIFVLGIVVAGSIGVYAGSRINADQITYLDKNNNEITVDTALNDLYDKADKNVTFGTVTQKSSQGIRTASRSSSLTLNKGKYIVTYTMSYAANNATSGGVTDAQDVNDEGGGTFTFTCNNGCVKQKLSRRRMAAAATTSVAGTSGFIQMYTAVASYYVTVTNDNTIVSATLTHTENAKYPASTYINAVPIN